MLTEFIAGSGSTRHLSNSSVGMKDYLLCDDYQLGTAGSGQRVTERGRGDFDVAFKSDSAENPGVIHTIIMHLKDVLHVPEAANNLLSLRAFDDEGLQYVGKDGMISMHEGETEISSQGQVLQDRRFACYSEDKT